MRLFFIILLCSTVRALVAQAPYTTAHQYTWSVESNLIYGTAPNYTGAIDTLRLDLYKPVGDPETERPLLVLVHGGAWLSGCKTDISWLATEMAGRGYVVAAVNYRLGWHKDDYVSAPICLYETARNLYPADSCEIYRAIYRGQQDVKGAIRWLKCRHLQDSTSLCRVLVGGESAGAFVSMAVGLLDRESEKPDCCAALADAPTPDPNLYNQTTLDCQLHNWTITPGTLVRPDLGSVAGNLNQNGYDAKVQGVLSFFGGVPVEALSRDWLAGPDTPAIYLYHQTCDGIVPFQYGRLFSTISTYCNTGCTPWHYNYPLVYGNGILASYFGAFSPTLTYTTDFQACEPFNPDLALFECIRYVDNGSYHFTGNQPLRAQNAADFFSPILTAHPCMLSGPTCQVSTLDAAILPTMRLRPNPFHNRLSFYCEKSLIAPALVQMSTMTGRLVWQTTCVLQAGNQEWYVPDLPAGAYTLRIITPFGTRSWLLFRQ